MLDHLSGGRFEFGTGRGAGSHEILGFLPEHERPHRAPGEIWEDVIREFPKMWMQDTYEGYEGKFWSLPPRKILPKPYVKPHPPMWYAAGNTSQLRDGRAATGLGVLGFSVGGIDEHEAGRSRPTSATIANAEPIGAFVNDNVMVTSGRVRRRRPRGGGAVDGRTVDCRTCRATCSATTTRSRIPTGRRSGPSCSPTPPPTRCAPQLGQPRAWSCGDPDDALQGLPGVGRRRRRPARLRPGHGHAGGGAGDDPPHRRARHPQDRHRPGAPHEPVPARGSCEDLTRPLTPRTRRNHR